MSGIIFPYLVAPLLIFSCLFYGSVTALPITIIETVVVLLILFWLIGMAYKRRFSFLETGLILPIALFLGLVVLQLIPLPIDLMRIICGNTAYLYKNLIPAGASKTFFTLSICPNATLSELFKVLTYIGIFFLIINKIETKRQFDYLINTIIFFGVVISIFGIIQKYTYSGKVYWFDASGSALTPFGPFVNRNNFSGYINMIIPLALGYFLTDLPWSKRVIYGLCMWIMVLALLLSLSRAGILVYILVLLFMLSLSNFKYSLKPKTKTLLVCFSVVFFLSIFFIDFKGVLERFANLFKDETLVVFGHGYSWWDTLRIWQDFHLFGTGLGTFASISSMYKTCPMQILFTYAHNDYLQLLSEVGLVGFLCISLFFILYFRKVLKMWRKRHNAYVISVVLGAMASIFAMLVYSLLDFNLHIPANALLFFVIMGLAYRLVYTRFSDGVTK